MVIFFHLISFIRSTRVKIKTNYIWIVNYQMFDIGIQYNIPIIYTLYCVRACQMRVLDPLMTVNDITY